MAINRRTTITSLLAWHGLALANRVQAATPPLLGEIAAYLDELTNLQSRFAQIAPNGEMSKGLLQLSRPGRLRMDYDPPSKILLVAPGDWRLIFYDGSIQQVNTIPIGQTPLGVLLDDRIEIERDLEIVELSELGGEVALTVTRPDNADQGAVTLVFERNPMTLRRWTIVDAQGLSTTIFLERIETSVRFADDAFHWRDPKIFGYPDD